MNDFYFILFGLFLALIPLGIEQVLSRRLSKRQSVVYLHVNCKGGRSIWK